MSYAKYLLVPLIALGVAVPAGAPAEPLSQVQVNAALTAGESHCNDFAGQGVVTCYSNETQANQRPADDGGCPAYVVFYGALNGGGASITLCHDYGNLGVLGWNNRIDSYKRLSSNQGRMWDLQNQMGKNQFLGAVLGNIANVRNELHDKISSNFKG